jgi:L-ascorbate metabolism protein UlaG (beta-lactamase superfamily)
VPRFPVSDHCDGDRFFNIDRSADRSFGDVVRWMRTRVRTPWPERAPAGGYPPPPATVAPGRVAVTFIGHATFLIRTASTVIVTDPVFTTHAGPFGRLGPRRVRPPGLAASALPPVDLVLVSHNHYDHLQPSSLRRFRTATFVVPLGLRRLIPSPGRLLDGPASYAFVENQIGRRSHPELDWWQTATVGDAEITAVPAQHFSARTPWDRNKTLWTGYVVKVDGVTIYFAGDTGYSRQFREIAARFPQIDVALLPIGAYEPRWFMIYAHMNPEEAVRAHVDLKARASVGMHFGTFQLTDEGIDEPLRALEDARRAARVDGDAFRVLGFGDSVTL